MADSIVALASERDGVTASKPVSHRMLAWWRGHWGKRLQTFVALVTIFWSARTAYATPVGREYLLQFLSNFGNPGICWVRNCLSDEEHSVRLAAFDCLEELGPRAVPVLLTSLKSEQTKERLESVWALGYIGEPAQCAGPALIESAADVDYQVRASSIMAMCRVGVEPKKAQPVVDVCLTDSSAYVRQTAARAISFMNLRDPVLHEKLHLLLQDHSGDVRAAAVETIGTMSEPTDGLHEKLISLTSDQHPQVRMEAERAIMRFRHRPAKVSKAVEMM